MPDATTPPSQAILPADDYRVLDAHFRAHLQTCEASGWNHFDDVVFKIAAGGLALSVTFLGVLHQSIKPTSLKGPLADRTTQRSA